MQLAHASYLVCRRNDDLPAFGAPTSAISAASRTSSRSQRPSGGDDSPSSENCGALRRSVLKCLFPRPPRPPFAICKRTLRSAGRDGILQTALYPPGAPRPLSTAPRYTLRSCNRTRGCPRGPNTNSAIKRRVTISQAAKCTPE
jgi:hypothetical protein